MDAGDDWPQTRRISQANVFFFGSWVIEGDGDFYFRGCYEDLCGGFGTIGDAPVWGDFNGDGLAQIGLFRMGGFGSFFLDSQDYGWSGCFGGELCMGLGLPGDRPVHGDFFGYGFEQVGVFRAGSWFIDNGNRTWDGCSFEMCVGFGMFGGLPVIGDFNGDGTAQGGLSRRGSFFLDIGDGSWDGCSSGEPDKEICFGLGQAGNQRLVADLDGDGRDQVGFFRDGSWFSDDGDYVWEGCTVDICVGFGAATAQSLIGDFDGDDDIATFDSGSWAIDDGNLVWDGCGGDACFTLGEAGDTPIVEAF